MRKTTTQNDDSGVSPVIGVILMVAITVILAAVIGTFVLGLGDSTQEPVNAGVNFDGTNEGVTMTVIDPGNVETFKLVAPNGNRSAGLGVAFQAGMKIEMREPDRNETRTVPAAGHLTTGATKQSEETCWVDHGGIDLQGDAEISSEADIPCDGGVIAGPQDLTGDGSADATIIQPGQAINLQQGDFQAIGTAGASAASKFGGASVSFSERSAVAYATKG